MFFFAEEGALFSGDAIPAAGHIPIDTDPVASVASVEKLKRLSDVRRLFSSWHEPVAGAQIAEIMDEGCRYLAQIDTLVRGIHAREPALSGEALNQILSPLNWLT